MTTTNINLELGDIIKLHAPVNERLNEKTFIISYIDENSIDIKSSDFETTLTLENEKITDESINKISVLFKNELKGFILQNNLSIGKWIDIEFGGDVPLIVTCQITDIIEDMIELKTYPDGKVFYIDFGYSGIPKDLNIERITIRDEPIKESVSDEVTKKDDPEVVDELSEVDEGTFDYDVLDVTPEQIPQVKIQDEIIEGSKIVFGESMGELIQVVDVDDSVKRFDLESQINDLLDEMLSKIPKQERTYKVINEIHTYIERFKQLREEFSEFDDNGNITEKILKGTQHKPLKKSLQELNKRIPWILPVVLNKKKIYNIEDEDNQFIIPIELNQNILEIDEITKQTTSTEEQFSLFKNILKQVKPYYTPFEQYISDLSIINKQTQTFIETIVNSEDFTFFSAKNDDIDLVKFHLTPYLTSETLNIIGYIILPENFITNSMKFLPGVNIAKKSIINKKPLLLRKYLLNKKGVKKIEINDTSKEYNYSNFFDSVKYIISTSEDKDYGKFIDTIIPRIRNFVDIISKNIKENEYIVSYNLFLSRLEPFFIYYDDLTFKNFTDINNIIFDEINKYKIQFINKQKQFEIYNNIRNSEFSKYKTYYSKIYQLLENYNVFNKKISQEEFLKLCLEKDAGKFLHSNISNINFKEYTGLKLDKESLQEKLISIKTQEDDNCSNFIISKKYTSLSQLENDNGKDIFFDKDRDPTRYDIFESFDSDFIESFDEDYEGLFTYIKDHLKKNIGLNDKNANKDAISMIEGQRKVEEDDICILEIDEKITYYIRKNNYWVIDRSINESHFKDKTKLLCNTNQLCISSNLDCKSTQNKTNELEKKDLNRIITAIEIEQNELIDNMKSKLIKTHTFSKKLLTFKLNNNDLSSNNIKKNIHNGYISNEKIISPYYNLLNAILSQKDFAKKQSDILRFESLFTIPSENTYIKNCKDTNTKLFPVFLAILAEAFYSDRYSETLDQVCKEQGVISDDGDKWVDKHSGMTIKYIDYSTEEGYDESGFKVVSRDILDNDIDLKVLMEEDVDKFKGDKGIINNVIMSITNFIGVNLKDYDIEELIEVITSIVKDKVPEKSVYDKKRSIALKKGSKLPTYEITYYNILLLSTISMLLIRIQTNIPSVVAKKSFPGCVRSFSGYPVMDETDISGIKYMACIAHKMKTDNTPWNTIKKVKEDMLSKQLQLFIKSITSNAYVKKRINVKVEYLVSNPETKQDIVNIIEWKTFLPDLNLTFKDKFVPLTKGYFESFNKDFKSSNRYYLYLILSKIYYLSLFNQNNIQNKVRVLKPEIVTNLGVPYLENSCDLTRYNEIKNWYDIKENEIACAYMDYYDYFVKNSKPNIRFNNTNSKLVYDRVPNVFTENVIYDTFIFYCSKHNYEDPILSSICKVDKADIVNKTKEELKHQGVNYNDDDLDILLKHIFNEKIVRNDISISIPFFELKNANLIEFDNLYVPLLNLSKNLYSKHKTETDKLRNYILEFNDEVKTNFISIMSGDLSYSKSKLSVIETFFNNMELWNTVNGSLTINSDDLTANTIITYLKNTLDNIGKTYPSIILNSINYSNINIRKNLKLSDRHISDIQKFVYAEVQPLEIFYENEELNKVLEKIITENNEILDYLKNGPPLNLNLEEDTYVLGKITMIEVHQFFISLIINTYLNEIYNQEDFSLKTKLGDLLYCYIEIINKNKETLNMTQEEMYNKLLKYKEVEKSEITTYLRDISDELREIENVMKNNKLGKWSKGQTKGLVTYTADTYDGEMIQQDLRDQKSMEYSVDISTGESISNEFISAEIDNEVNNLGFLGNDDDFGELDGDEGF